MSVVKNDRELSFFFERPSDREGPVSYTHLTFLMISSSNNLGLKMVEVHADLNPCAKEGTASRSLPIRRGKGNGWFWIDVYKRQGWGYGCF